MSSGGWGASVWNPWHGCRKFSEGCAHCYVYRRDESVGRDASQVSKTASFSLAVRRNRDGSYKLPPGEEVYLCMTSDFFLEEADPWRPEIFRMIRQRPDVPFLVITKRIGRFWDCIPPDWGDGYPNLSIGCTIENQRRCEERLPFFLTLPIRERFLVCEPLLEEVHFGGLLGPGISRVIAGGESGPGARLCRYQWVLSLRQQCLEAGVAFRFKQTGAQFEKDGRVYRIPRAQQHAQASRAGIDLDGPAATPQTKR